METGSRREMVFKDGLRFGNLRRRPACQSMNSVESFSAQNSRSFSSDRNSGIRFFVLGIGLLLFAVHVANRYDSDQVAPNGERNKQISLASRLAQGVVSLLALRITWVAANDQRLIEKHIFGFFRSDLMPIPILLNVGFIPIKSGTFVERVVRLCQKFQYTSSIYSARRSFWVKGGPCWRCLSPSS